MGWTLAVAFVAVAVGLIWRLRSRSNAEPKTLAPASDRYRIGGRVELTSTCGSPDGALPQALRIATALSDGRQTRVEALVEVALDEAASETEGEQRLEGSYELSVEWDGERPPLYWEPVRATRPDGRDPCEGLGCEGPNRCVNIASRPRRIEVSAIDTELTLRVACICVPE